MLLGLWDLTPLGVKSVFPELANGFFTTEPPRKLCEHTLDWSGEMERKKDRDRGRQRVRGKREEADSHALSVCVQVGDALPSSGKYEVNWEERGLPYFSFRSREEVRNKQPPLTLVVSDI